MITELDEAIKHCKEVAKEFREKAKLMREGSKNGLFYPKDFEDCETYAENHEQLAKWFTELAERREADRWIPVSEKLPEDYTKVLITNEYGTVTCVSWNTWYQNEYKDAKKGYKAIAWKPLPKPYTESEDK